MSLWSWGTISAADVQKICDAFRRDLLNPNLDMTAVEAFAKLGMSGVWGNNIERDLQRKIGGVSIPGLRQFRIPIMYDGKDQEDVASILREVHP